MNCIRKEISVIFKPIRKHINQVTKNIYTDNTNLIHNSSFSRVTMVMQRMWMMSMSKTLYFRMHPQQWFTLTISSYTPRYKQIAYQKERGDKKVQQRLLAFLASVIGQLFRYMGSLLLTAHFTLFLFNYSYRGGSWFRNPKMSHISCYCKSPLPLYLDKVPHYYTTPNTL